VPPGDPADPAGPEARHDLGTRQKSLVAALLTGGKPPAGLDGQRVRAQSIALVRKRARAVARTRPELAAALGPSFSLLFREYAASTAGAAHTGDAAADCRAFARYVRASRHALSRTARQALRRAALGRPPRYR
jgi:hypothetical protein